MKFGIYSNLTRDIGGKSVTALADLLAERAIPFAFSSDLKKTGYACQYLSNEELARECDVIILFGGDGTVLHYAKICAAFGTPIFAVNLGRVGFLTESNHIDFCAGIDKILSGDYILESRAMLNISACGSSFTALNDCVISRGAKASMIDLEYRINGYLTEKVRSDALIVSTPTGSTAYSLSCGGSIVDPGVNGILITPVSPYTLISRPLIVSDESEVTVVVKTAAPAYLNIDGEDILEIPPYQAVKINKAKVKVGFIRLDEGSFYNKLLIKNSLMES